MLTWVYEGFPNDFEKVLIQFKDDTIVTTAHYKADRNVWIFDWVSGSYGTDVDAEAPNMIKCWARFNRENV